MFWMKCNLSLGVGIVALLVVWEASGQTAEAQKVNPSLVQAAKSNPSGVVEVNVRAGASRALFASIARMGGGVVKFEADGKTIRVRLPLASVQTLAARPEVERIDPVGGANGSAGMVVFVDPVTRQFRAPTAAEMNDLTSRAKASAPATGPQFRYGPGNTVGMILGPEDMVLSVATVGADGKLKTDCVQGESAAKTRSEKSSETKGKATNAKQ